jgi:hypothetical protein
MADGSFAALTLLRIADGKWLMADGKWLMADGKWLMADGKWLMARSLRSLYGR